MDEISQNEDILDGELMPNSEALALEEVRARPRVTSAGAMAADVYNSLFEDDLGENPRQKRAFQDYVGLGKIRTLKRLAEMYVAGAPESGWTDNFESVLRQLKDYSTKFKWQDRVRFVQLRATAEVLASAQKDAYVHSRERIKLARLAQDAGRTIIEKAELSTLSVGEARMLLKQGVTLFKEGNAAERAEQGDILAAIRPPKEISQMSDEELNEFAGTLQAALVSGGK